MDEKAIAVVAGLRSPVGTSVPHKPRQGIFDDQYSSNWILVSLYPYMAIKDVVDKHVFAMCSIFVLVGTLRMYDGMLLC